MYHHILNLRNCVPVFYYLPGSLFTICKPWFCIVCACVHTYIYNTIYKYICLCFVNILWFVTCCS